MFKSRKQKKAINLVNPAYAPGDAFTKIYDWMINIGKYLLIFVELVVLGVFFSRFILDRRNNNLTDEINDQIALLQTDPWRTNNILYGNYQKLLADIGMVKGAQKINSSVVSEIVSGIPSTLILKSFSLNGNRVSLHLLAGNLEDVKVYESSLKDNTHYSDVTFSILKEDVEISVAVSFNLVQNVD